VNDVRARVASGDFDGDGRTDFIVSDGSTGWKVCRSNGVSVFTCNTAGGMAPFVSTKTQSALFGDFNGDGRTDIAIPPVGDGSGFGSWSICLSTSTLDTFSCSSVSNAPTASSTRTGYYGLNIEDYLVGDFVGDGKDHIVMPDGGSAGNVCTWLSTVAPFSCQSQFANVGSAKSTTDYDEGTGYRRDAIVGDLNGDGRLDIVGVQTRPAQIPLQPFASIVSSSGFATSFAWNSGLGTTGQTIPAPPWDIGASVTGDLHGSGYSDLVLYFLNTSTQTSDTYICRSTGVAPFDCSGRFTRYPDNQVYNVVHVADFDGDGRPDVLVGINRSLTPLYAVCQVYGDHYNDQPCPQWSTAAFANSELGPIFGDFDGDGLTDLLTYNTSSGQWTVYKAAAAPQDVLNTVTDGYGRITTITYKSLNDSATYTPEYSASYPQRNVNAGLWVVSQVSVDNGVGGNFVTNYHYRGYQVDAKGRGSLGFHVVDATDQTSSIKTTTTYRQDFPYTGMVSSVASVYQLGSMPTLRQSTNTFALGPASGGSGSYNGTAPYYAQFPFVQTTSEMVNDLDGSQIATISSNFGYDSNGYGNLTTSSVTTTANSVQYLSSSSYTYQAAIVDSVAITNPRWVVNLLSELQVRKTSPTSDKTRTTDFTYDLTYFDLATQIIEPYDATSDHAYKLTTVFGRDSYGNVNSRTLQWKDATGIDKSRVVEQLDFTATSGRYPRTIKNAPPFSQTETRYYDDRTGKPTQITAIDGVTTTWTYDGFGRVASETHADQTITGYKYVKCNSGIDPDCTVRGITGTAAVIADTTSLAITGSPRVQVPSMRVLDRLGREILTKTWSFDGTKVLAERTYDGQGYLHSVARPHKTTESPVDTTYAYDNLGRVTAVTYPTDTGFTSDSMSYTANTKTTNLSTGGQRVELSNGLDKLARVTERITGSPVTTTKIDYAYDGFGNLAQTTDQNAVPVIVTYDLLGRKTGLNDRDLGNVTYKVNALGLTWQQTDAKGQVSQFTFDELNRMTDRVESGANTGHWTYDTNLAGHLATATTTNYSRTHYYDSVGRLSQLVTSITDATYGTQAFTSTYRYDAYGRKQSATHQHSSSQHAPVVVGYGYNLQGMLYQLAGTDASYWTVNQRDAVDHVTQETLGNGLITNRGYFSNSARLSTTQTGPSGSVQSDSYSYDVVGRLGQRSNKVGPNAAVSETFSYDLINRLTSSTIGSTTKTYGYDATGNITSKTGVGTYSYGQLGGCNPATARPHAVTGITGTINTTFCYDANGNLTSGNGLTISWTAFNQPTQVYKDGAHYDQFAYGPEHQRVTHLQLNGTSNQTFFYAGAMDLVGGTPGTLRTYLPFSLGVVVDTGSGTRAVSYFHRDHLGSTEAISNAAGNYVEGFSYDPWGKRRNLDGSDAASITANNDRYGYTGQEMLDGTGLVHLNGRVYDPLLGKFQAADPYVDRWSETQGHNRFTYALNSATNTTDSTGYVALKLNDSARFPSLKDQEVEFPPVTVTGRSSLGAFMLSLSNRVYLRPMAERMVRRAAIGVAVPAAGFVVGTVCKGMAAVGCGAAALAGAYYIANNREKVYDLLRPIISENGEDQGQNGSDGLSKDKGASVEKPKGIPDNWREEPTRGEGGRQWVNPDNPGDRVRVMPGNPDSPNPGQREPYVRDVRNGNQWLDVNGNRVEGSEGRNSPSTHIPLSDYVFRH
jgi:RHS repeat-associated protein